MNEYDSQRMAQLLMHEYLMTANPREANLILINTCSVREKAEHKLYSLLGRLRSYKERNPRLKIGVTGCVAQQLGEKLFARMPHVDFVLGPHCLYALPDILQRLEEGYGHIAETRLIRDFEIPFMDAPLPQSGEVRAFITIMQGCDNFCTFCIVPFVRGRETSRPPKDIIREIELLIDQGIRDITLLGQNVNSYGRNLDDVTNFPWLLRQIAERFTSIRLRFTTSHPKDLTEDLMKCFSELDILCEHLHLPVQSGSDRVLRRMNRHYSALEYLDKVERLRDICPEITITTDLIVGFPGETEEDFFQTLSLMKRARFDQAFAFKYSERPGTAAAGFREKIREEIKRQRLQALIGLQKEIGLAQYKKYENKVVSVLIEDAKGMKLKGRTRGNHVVNLAGSPELVGKTLDVYIERACYHSLVGKIVH